MNHIQQKNTIKKKKKRTPIGRKLKNSQKASVRKQYILTNETQYQSESIQNYKANNGKNHGIETGHNMSGQSNASSQYENESNIESCNFSESSSKFKDNKQKSKYKKYNESKKGRDRVKKYFSTQLGKAAQKRYFTTEGGKAAQKEAYKTYVTTEGGKAAQKEAYKTYVTTEGGKAAQKEAYKTYVTTEGGKAAQKRYSTTEGGKAAQKEAYKTYVTTEHGKIKRKAAANRYNKTHLRQISLINYKICKR